MKYPVGVSVALVLAVAALSPLRAGLLAFGLVVLYCLFALVRPHRRCGRCGGTRRSKRYFGLWGRGGKCRKCRGRGTHQRFGAPVVHRFFWITLGERWMEHRKASQREGDS